MDTDSLYRRLDIIEWMMTLPPGENDSKIEAAINNCKEEGRSTRDIIQFVNLAFRSEIDQFISWLDEMKCKPIK
jgi:hypothetical protein